MKVYFDQPNVVDLWTPVFYLTMKQFVIYVSHIALENSMAHIDSQNIYFRLV